MTYRDLRQTIAHSSRRLPAVLGGLLAATGLTLLTAVPAAAAPPGCTAWAAVPFSDLNSGWVNDRHARVGTETQECRWSPGAAITFYARATYTTVSADTWPRQQEGITLRISEAAGGPIVWQVGSVPEPAIGQTYYETSTAVTPGHGYATDAAIYYVDPPNPLDFQTGGVDWTSPTVWGEPGHP